LVSGIFTASATGYRGSRVIAGQSWVFCHVALSSSSSSSSSKATGVALVESAPVGKLISYTSTLIGGEFLYEYLFIYLINSQWHKTQRVTDK